MYVAARHEKILDYMKNKFFEYFLVRKRAISNDDVRGGAQGTVFQEIRPGAGCITGDLVEEEFGGLP